MRRINTSVFGCYLGHFYQFIRGDPESWRLVQRRGDTERSVLGLSGGARLQAGSSRSGGGPEDARYHPPSHGENGVSTNIGSYVVRSENPHQYSTGVEYVVVNGTLVIEQGEHTGARPGMILYGPGKPE